MFRFALALVALLSLGFAHPPPIGIFPPTTCRFTGCPSYEMSLRAYMLASSTAAGLPSRDCHYGYQVAHLKLTGPSDQRTFRTRGGDVQGEGMNIVGTCKYDSKTGALLGRSSPLVTCANAQVQCWSAGRDW